MITEEEIEQVLQWIGKPNARTRLLFTSSNDNSPATFHKACDKKGATVTVALAQTGFLFGAYTSQSWDIADMVKPDKEAFLFRLRGKAENRKIFTQLSPAYVQYETACGPIFGSDSQYEFFIQGSRATINPCNVFFEQVKQPCVGKQMIQQNAALNAFQFGAAPMEPFRANKGAKGIKVENGQYAEDLFGNPGSCRLCEWRVYQILVPKVMKQTGDVTLPWRKSIEQWNKKTLDCLKSEVSQYSPPEATHLEYANVLLVGPTGAGKSSFFNTVSSVYRGHVVPQAPTGTTEHGLTTKFRRYAIKSGREGDRRLKIRLCDTPGIKQKDGLCVGDITYVIDGNIPSLFQFHPFCPVTPETSGFITDPEWKDKMHVMAIVLDAQLVEDISDELCEKMHAVRTQAQARGLPLVLLLTHIDGILEDPHQLSGTFHSQALLSAVDDVACKMGIPRGHVLPIKNYESETELDDQVDILTLAAVRQILRFADAYFDDQIDLKDECHHINAISKTDKLDQPN